MNNTITNSKSNEKVVAEKRATKLKKTILTSTLSFGIVLGSIPNGICMEKKNNGNVLKRNHSSICRSPSVKAPESKMQKTSAKASSSLLGQDDKKQETISQKLPNNQISVAKASSSLLGQDDGKQETISPKLPDNTLSVIFSYLTTPEILVKIFPLSTNRQLMLKKNANIIFPSQAKELMKIFLTNCNNQKFRLGSKFAHDILCKLKSENFDTVKIFHLNNCDLSNAKLQPLTKFTNLTNLNLSSCNIGNEELKHIVQLTKLNSLDLSDNKICDCGLSYVYVSKLINLSILNLAKNRIEGYSVASCIQQLKNLTKVDLRNNCIRIDNLHLIYNPSLKSLILDISHNDISKAQADSIESQLPNIKILCCSASFSTPINQAQRRLSK